MAYHRLVEFPGKCLVLLFSDTGEEIYDTPPVVLENEFVKLVKQSVKLFDEGVCGEARFRVWVKMGEGSRW